MYKITQKKDLAPNIFLMDIYAPRVAKSAKPGQFIILKTDEKGERVPLTICDYDIEKGTVTIVVQIVGATTQKIADLNVGEELDTFVGPLGNPSEFIFENLEELRDKKILFIAGGVGTAPVYPQLKWLHEKGVDADIIIGAKSENFVLLEEDIKKVSGNLYIATDDGSRGFKGLVTGCLEDLIENHNKHYDVVISIGPMIMMKFVAMTTKKYNIKTIVSLNSLMVDGTGMCGACRVTVAGKTRFTCVEGPEFDGHEVDFDEAMRRQGQYKTIESRKAKALEEQRKGHKCKVGLN